MTFNNPPPCEKPSECRIVSLGGTSTLMAWSPVYDRDGNRIGGQDPNTYTAHYRCNACGKGWSEAQTLAA